MKTLNKILKIYIVDFGWSDIAYNYIIGGYRQSIGTKSFSRFTDVESIHLIALSISDKARMETFTKEEERLLALIQKEQTVQPDIFLDGQIPIRLELVFLENSAVRS